MAKVIVITSGKGGVGKTTTAVNLGIAMNSFDADVIVIDANLTTPNIGLHLGAPIVPVTLNHVLSGKAQIIDAIYEHNSGTKIVPSSLSIKDLENVNSSKLKNVIKNLQEISDYIVIDSGAGLGEEVLGVIELADEIVIVTNPEMPAVTDALKTAKVAQDMGKYVRGVIVTKVKNNKIEMPLNNIKEMLEIPILGIIPEDSAVQEALAMKNAVYQTHPDSRAAQHYEEIAAKLLGKEHIQRKRIREKEGFLKKFLRGLGLRQ